MCRSTASRRDVAGKSAYRILPSISTRFFLNHIWFLDSSYSLIFVNSSYSLHLLECGRSFYVRRAYNRENVVFSCRTACGPLPLVVRGRSKLYGVRGIARAYIVWSDSAAFCTHLTATRAMPRSTFKLTTNRTPQFSRHCQSVSGTAARCQPKPMINITVPL